MIGRRSHDDAQSFEAALRGGAPRDANVAELVRLAEDICAAAVVEPSPAFRDSLRTQLMAEAATVLVPVAPAAHRVVPAAKKPVRRRLAALTAAAVAAAGVVGLVASSASAVPGEMLYPVKRSVESVEMQLHRSDASRGAFQLTRASERLAEARQLSADGESSTLIADTLDDFSDSAADGSTKLFAEFDDSGEEKAIRTVNDFAAASSLDLTALSSQLPDDVTASFEAAKNAVTDLASEASSLCGGCTPADVGALVTAVTGPARDTATPTNDVPPSTPSQRPSTPRATAASPAPAPAPTPAKPTSTPRPASTPAPTTPTLAPTPPPATKTPSLTDVTDPLVGGLLGDEEQTGLVPGLLNELLGTPPTPTP
ncbi:MAG: DUF5667 domain-containing protein [Aeromicrobium sp.]